MRRYLLFILLVIYHFQVAGQDNMEVKNIVGMNDTAAISGIINTARKLRHKNPDSTIYLYQNAFILSKQAGFIEGIARSLTGLGLSYMDKGEYDKSLFTYKLARPYCEEASRTNKRALAVLYNNIAALYGNRGITDTAIMFYHKALEEIEKRKVTDTNMFILIYSNLGGRLAVIGHYNQANFYIDKGEAMAKLTHNAPMLAKIYLDKTVVFAEQKKYDSVRHYSSEALAIFRTHADPASQVNANCNIAASYLSENKLPEAIAYYRAALDDNINASRTQQAPALKGLGECYYKLKDYKKAEAFFLEMLSITKEANTIKGVANCYKSLVDVYTDMGNYKLAQKYRNDYDKLIDSTENAEKLKSLSELESKYRIAEKDKDIVEKQMLLTQKENELQQKNIWIGSITCGMLLVTFLFISMYRTRKHKENLNIMRMDKEREVGQLKAMMKGEEKERIRIARELHDGIMVRFSSVQMNLSAIIERSETEQPNKLEDILFQLEEATKELRKSAHNLMPDMLLQEGLGEAAHYFCKTLQRSSGIEIDFQQYGDLPRISPDYELMAYRIIQELLQNILKHAKASAILVQLNCQPHMLSIAVEDNGIGFDRDQLPPYKGMGLKSIEERVHSLHGNISITSKKEMGTSVYIELDTQYLQQINADAYAHNGSYS